MTIREATDADTPRLVEMAIAFIAESRYQELIPQDLPSIHALIAHLLGTGTVIHVADLGIELVGMIGVKKVAWAFGPICDEAVWWVEPEHRGRIGMQLLREAEKWAIANGCIGIKLIAPSGSDIGKLYERCGYEPIETTYFRRLAA
jgi:GNAT superfamily N-acetyltransferase